MPRTYVKKRTPTYGSSDLEIAKEEVKRGSSVYAAAKKFNIPYETLRRWHECPPSHQGAGRGTVLSKEEEQYIVSALVYTAKCGYPLDRQDLKYMVNSYVKSVDRKTPFKDDMPGYDFIVAFEKRWKDSLVRRKPELLTKSRAEGLSQFVVGEFFTLYQQVLDDNNLNGHPERIFNLDETGLATDPTKGKVFVPKSARVAYSRSGGAGKLQYSVLFVASADGERYPPCVIFKGTGALQSTWVQNGPTGALYGVTESGWMQDYIFEKWLNAFVNKVKHIEKPILVIFDGHGSHLTYNVTCTAREHNIILLCLPPNTSHALQPLDVGVFAPMKNTWRDILRTWYRESRLKNIDKAIFPSLLKKLMAVSFKAEHVIGGFKGSGLYPVNKDALVNKIVSVESVEMPVPENASSNRPNNPNDDLNLPGPSSSNSEANNLLGSSSRTTHSPTNEPYPSPMKKLREAIIQTLSPEQSAEVKAALANSKRKRRRVQNSVGEVLTSEEVQERLKEEEELRNENKKLKNSRPRRKAAKELGVLTKCKKEEGNGRLSKVVEKLVFESDESEEGSRGPIATTSSSSEIITGSWVSVNYQSECGKTVKEYRGQVIGESQDAHNKKQYNVKFLIQCKGDGHRYIFPEVDDIECVDVSQISEVFSVPDFNGRYFKFTK